MLHPQGQLYWGDLETHAHLPKVQQLIREEIRNGTIRVRTKRDGGIRIMPVGEPARKQLAQMNPQRAEFQDGGSPRPAPVRRSRLTQRQQCAMIAAP
jgi:hypothetical protein